MGKMQGRSLAPRGSICTHLYIYHRLRRTLHHTLWRTQRITRGSWFLTFFLLVYSFACLASLSSRKYLSLCAFPISFPNRSLYYSRNCQGKQTIKMASLPIVRPQRWFSWKLGLTMFPWWIFGYFLLRDGSCWWVGCNKGWEKMFPFPVW